MTAVETELWQRIAKFEFDEPSASHPFSRRLANDNGWTRTYAIRVLEEYRRFAFLAVAAGHPVSPSDAVDQAWHEHLTYTRDYWQEFCGKALGQPLHHEPTQGGGAESAKFNGWYADTLASYRKFFQTEPPADVWPALVDRVRKKEHFERVDLAANWVIPKPGAKRSARLMAMALSPLGLSGCAGLVAVTIWPFDLPGRSFLAFFALLIIVAVAAAFWLRSHLRGSPAQGKEDNIADDAVTAALLNSGSVRAVAVTVADMIWRDLLKLTKGRIKTVGPLPGDASPLERLVYAKASDPEGAKWMTVQKAGSDFLAPNVAQLRQRGLVVTKRDRTRIPLISTAPLWITLLVGGLKVAVGLQRSRPVEFLVVACVLLLVFTLILLMQRPWRTHLGDERLDQLLGRHGDLKAEWNRPQTDARFALAFALFGAVALPEAMGDLKRRFGAIDGGGSFVGSCGSGCGGGSSCGGGSGCGGCGGGH